MDEDVTECCEARFWEMVPGSIVGTLLLQVILCYKVSCVCSGAIDVVFCSVVDPDLIFQSEERTETLWLVGISRGSE
jgi:hypothetical protein